MFAGWQVCFFPHEVTFCMSFNFKLLGNSHSLDPDIFTATIFSLSSSCVFLSLPIPKLAIPTFLPFSADVGRKQLLHFMLWNFLQVCSIQDSRFLFLHTNHEIVITHTCSKQLSFMRILVCVCRGGDEALYITFLFPFFLSKHQSGG